MKYLDSKIINGQEYRLVKVRNRTKWVSKDGDLINPHRPNQKVSEYILNSDGYPITGGSIPVHLYVAYGWVDGWFDGAEVNHKDFDRTNYHADNLEWTTHKENVRWSVDNNDSYSDCKRGVRNGRATFTEEDVKEIREMHKNGMSVFDIIRKREGLTDYDEIKRISSKYYYLIKNKSWKNVS